MPKTKRIETGLSLKQFHDRIKLLCREKTRFDRGYHGEDVFVIKRGKKRIALCKHYASVGRSDGYANDCIFFRYAVNGKGFVELTYRFGKRFLFLTPFLICMTAGFPLWVGLLYEAFFLSTVEWGGLCVTAFFWLFGLCGILFRSRKERALLEEHLLKICGKKL